jgi:DNA-binding transcriptional ArsR family regulator
MRLPPLLLLFLAGLGALAAPAAAAREVIFYHGEVKCSVGAQPYTTVSTDRCGPINNERASLQPTLRHHITGAVYELNWTAARLEAAPDLTLAFPRPVAKTTSVDTNGQLLDGFLVYGRSLLRIQIEGGRAGETIYDLTEDGKPSFEVRATRGVVHEQPYVLAFTWFQDEPIPQGYSAFRDVLSEAAPASPDRESVAPLMLAAPTTSRPLAAWVVLSSAVVLVSLAWHRLWARTLRGGLLGAAALFTRIERDDALAHPKREALEQLVRSEPGISYAEARARLRLGAGAFDYHLRVLLRHRILTQSRAAGRVRLFLAGQGSSQPSPGPASLILALVRAEPGLSRAQLASRLDLHEDTLGYHATWLCRRGLLEKRDEGRLVRYFPAASAARSEAF